MMVMTAKVDLKKILIILGVIAALILGAVMLFGGSKDTQSTAAPSATDNDQRVKFLKDQGWEVSTSPVQSGKVQIPAQEDSVYERYNTLQKSQGYDLNQYAGKTVMRYVYKINNFPGATDPVYATLLVYKDQVIGGDITNTAADGRIQGFKKAQTSTPAEVIPETTAPLDSTTPPTA